jgi:alkanesulfonate monooxygenase SsuD/methylene tetrahydromethanopterin reductase-like flavin-dependent oxidoreductase (luciferase family)
VGSWADGLITVSQPPDALRRVLDAFREGAGDGAPAYLQVHVCWAPTASEATAIAHDQWRSNVFAPPVCWDVATAEEFDAASRFVRPEDVAEQVIVASDPREHLDRLSELMQLGFDGVWIHHVGQEQTRFIETFGEHVVPALRQVGH